MGTNENSKEHSYITWHNFWGEKKIGEEKRKDKKENKNQREWISPLTRKTKRVNKNGKLSQKMWVD